MPESEEKKESKPGYFESDLKDYPGYIQFPHPFMLQHVEIWYKLAIEALKELDAVDYKARMAVFDAGAELLLSYGEIKLKGISDMQIKNSSQLPAAVARFIVSCSMEYIPPFFPWGKL